MCVGRREVGEERLGRECEGCVWGGEVRKGV